MAIWILQPDSAGNCCDCTARTEPCDTCGVTGCACYGHIGQNSPFTQPNFVSYGAATTGIAQSFNCYPWTVSFLTNQLPKLSFSEATNDYSVVSTTNGMSAIWFALSVNAGTTLTLDFSVFQTFTGPCSNFLATSSIVLFDCNANEIQSFTDSANASSLSSSHTCLVPEKTVVYIGLTSNASFNGGGGAGCSTTGGGSTFRVRGDKNIVAVPAVALWDDSGTTRVLEACPKMIIPPLAEKTGSWYASKTDAQNAINTLVSNCISYGEDTLSESGGVITVAGATEVGVNPSNNDYFSVNLQLGAVVSMTYSLTNALGLGYATMIMYDSDGNQLNAVGTNNQDSGTFSLPAVSWPGRYIILVFFGKNAGGGTVSVGISATISSSPTLTVNNVQALYDVGLDCPARLNC